MKQTRENGQKTFWVRLQYAKYAKLGKSLVVFEKMAKNLNLGHFWTDFAQNCENGVFFGKSGSVTFKPFMCNIKKIFRAVFEISN